MNNKLLRLLVPVIILFFSDRVGAQIISTVVGNGSSAYSGDNGAALSASLDNPRAIDVDASGNVYIADYQNNVIRKVSAATNIITTIAGTGTVGYTGDNGPAISATLNTPSWVSVDNVGNIYIADIGNYVVRKINTSGIITTVAGTGTPGYTGDKGKATNAQLYWPIAVIPDKSGNIYISDYNNMSVRKVSSAGIITTVAGNGTAGWTGDGGPAYNAELSQPAGIALDAAGNLYIADYSNYKIRKVSTSGIITTVAGDGTYGDGGDGGQATGTSMAGPVAVAVDPNGNLYISDAGASRIRFVQNSSGKISTFAGNGTPGYGGDNGHSFSTACEVDAPFGSKLDRYGNFFFADQHNNVIRVISNSNNPISGVKPVNERDQNLVISPNPNKGDFYIKGSLNSSDDELISIEVLNVVGQVVYNNSLMASSGVINSHIEMGNNLPAGVYVMQVKSGSNTETLRLAIEK